MRPEMNMPEDVALLAEPEERVVEVAPGREPRTPSEWIKENLFSGPLSSILTVVLGIAAAFFGYQLLRWIFGTADWQVVKANLRIYMIGRFPLEEAWRIWASVYYVVLLGGVSFGVLGPKIVWTRRRTILRVVLTLLFLGALIYLIESPTVWILIAGTIALTGAGIALGRRSGDRLRKPITIGWLLAFPVILVVVQLLGGVPPRAWGGFFLINIMVAVAAIFLSFPVGILLALGRRSKLPAMRWFSVGFIELFRGVPLVTLIISGEFILPLMFPPGFELSRIPRMIIMYTIFSSAYVAEIVRGGLQGVPEGQYEASRALALPGRKMMRLIVLPQALRNTIPAMISHFISLFKDTSLLAALAILELLRAARRASAQLEFSGDVKEALIAAALLFWIVSFSMSRWSQRLERRLGVGER